MNLNDLFENLRTDNPCWKGYKPVGTKEKNGRTVPNCVPKESVAEVSDDTLISYMTKVDADSQKHKSDPTKRSPEKANKSVSGFSRAFNKLDARKGVAEGSEQIYNILALDKGNALKKPTKLKWKASSLEDIFDALAAQDWYPLEINGVEVIAGKRLKQGVAEGTGNIGASIKALYQKIYNAGDDEIEYFYNDSPIFAQYWDEYEGDLDSIIAEVDPAELQVMHDELASYVQNANLAEGEPAKQERPEADYGDDYQAMVGRVKKLAGLGPLKTVWDPQKRVYKNVPVAQQPKK